MSHRDTDTVVGAGVGAAAGAAITGDVGGAVAVASSAASLATRSAGTEKARRLRYRLFDQPVPWGAGFFYPDCTDTRRQG